jgi:hypothetical protein
MDTLPLLIHIIDVTLFPAVCPFDVLIRVMIKFKLPYKGPAFVLSLE